MQSTSSEIASLEAKIVQLEGNNLQQFQKQMLASLYQIREALIEDIKQIGNVNVSAKTQNEKDMRISELEAENKKLNYRITHLSRNLREQLEKQA